MDAHRELVTAWHQRLPHMARSPAFQKIAGGGITTPEYAAMLRQIFHHARENPQIQALATARFRGNDRQMVRAFLGHACSEIGHDELALRDLEALGEDVRAIRTERPLPATFALLASVFYMIEHHDPAGYLGYLFHLEFTPVQLGRGYMEALERSGIPRAAMGFLEEHASVDVAHCRLMERYCAELIRTSAQLDAALYMQRLTAELYARMLEQALASAADREGVATANPEEIAPDPERDAIALAR
jgi:pyrroloquinoline quinone (PQQ) biosynthesis protein C